MGLRLRSRACPEVTVAGQLSSPSFFLTFHLWTQAGEPLPHPVAEELQCGNYLGSEHGMMSPDNRETIDNKPKPSLN